MLTWLLLLFFGVTFAIVSLVVLLIAFAVEKPGVAGLVEEDAAGTLLLKSEQLSSISAWDSLLNRFDFVEIMKLRMAQADLGWSVGRLTMSMLLSGTVTLVALSRISWVPGWAGLASTAMAAMAPYGYVLRHRSRRFDAFASQFPDALDSLGRAMRAGHPLIGALDLVARESVAPVSTEVRKLYVETNLGLPIGRALENLRDRVPIAEVDLFAMAVQLHARTGGRLTDVMTGLSESMREQIALRGEVRAISAHGRITGIVLTIVPIAIALMLTVVSPMYIGVLLAYPYGKHMIAAAGFCLIAAHFVIRRIVDIRI
jgi:tight adherence protein B